MSLNGNLIVSVGQTIAQVEHPTMQLYGRSTRALRRPSCVNSISYTSLLQVTKRNSHPMQPSMFNVRNHGTSFRGTPCHLSWLKPFVISYLIKLC